jgi:hypothetical protein
MMTEAEKACDWEYPPFRPLLYLSRLTAGFYLNFSFSELGWVKSGCHLRTDEPSENKDTLGTE